ncbi:MAG TPA: SDR family oxidoreductase [Gemmatimonadales bacterium]|nr:SDR family oxidoreductase [Gemmatimonadales bacterium]
MSEPPVAIITASSSGIGAACARELASRGHRVVLMSRSQDAETMATSLGGIGVRGDVANAADLERLVRTTLDSYGRIDVLVNNTGHVAKGDLLSIPDTSWEEGLALLLLNVVRLARLVVPVMEQQGGGAIVNISSLWAAQPHLDAPVSSVFRAGLGAFTKLFADRYGPVGIRMNCVLPGFVEEADPAFLAATPLGRPATLEEVGRVVAFLASSDASYITGQSLRVDGGLTRGM